MINYDETLTNNMNQDEDEDGIETLFQDSMNKGSSRISPKLFQARVQIHQFSGSAESFGSDFDNEQNYETANPMIRLLTPLDENESKEILVISSDFDSDFVFSDKQMEQSVEKNNIGDGMDEFSPTNSSSSSMKDRTESLKFDSSFEQMINKNRDQKSDLEASRRYLTINTTPMFRWSMNMIPGDVVNKNKQRQQKKPSSIQKNNQSVIKDNSLKVDDRHAASLENDEDDDEDIMNNSIFDGIKKKSSKPVIVSGNKIRSADSIQSSWIIERMKHLAKAYSERGEMVKKTIENLPKEFEHSDSEDSSDLDSKHDEIVEAQHQASLLKTIFDEEWAMKKFSCVDEELKKKSFSLRFKFLIERAKVLIQVLEPQSNIYIGWLFLVSITFIYNAVFPFYRAVFPNELGTKTWWFIILDVFSDLIYLLDIVWFNSRLKFIEHGQWIEDRNKMFQHYIKSSNFAVDLLASLPIDWILFVYYGGDAFANVLAQRLSRLNRLIKIGKFWEFFRRIDQMMDNPYFFRIIHTLLYKLYIIHFGACVYYLSSSYIGFGETPWSYNNEGNAYLRCFYFAFRTTTSIGGRLPKPSSQFERIYMLVAWLLGVFVFAMVIGQIRDIVNQASRNQNYYIESLNKIGQHMMVLNIPEKLVKRVRFWLNTTWKLQKTFNENEVLQMLPLKMRTDISLSIHYRTLSRVQLFKNIDISVLRDLILKLRPILYLPGDFICHRGDIGHDMYIVSTGHIQVLDPQTGNVLVTLAEGSVFGEIAILNLNGQTKRTADVRSCGYSQLFALKKNDLWETLKNYPEYQKVLIKKVQRVLRKKKKQQELNKSDSQEQSSRTTIDQKKLLKNFEKMDDCCDGVSDQQPKLNETMMTNFIEVESLINDRPQTPKFFQTVLGVIRQESASLNRSFIGSSTLNKLYRSYSYETSFSNIDSHSQRRIQSLDWNQLELKKNENFC